MASYDKKLAQEIARKLPDKTLFNRVLADEHAAVTTECLVQTGYVVDYLYDNQIPFRIEQTTSGGYLQLQAVTDSPKARITLTGKNDGERNHIDFIGSAIKAEQRYAFTATPYDASGRPLSGQSSALRTFRPGKEDIARLLDSYLKSDMTSFMAPDATRTIEFESGRPRSFRNAYYQNGRLRKGYKTLDAADGAKQDVELSVQPIQANVNGELSSLSNAVRTVSSAINDSRDYLMEELMRASDFMLGKKAFGAGNKPASPMDYGIESGDIADMAVAIRDLCADADSEYGIELAESTQPTETLRDIVRDYVSTNVLGLSKDAAGNLIELPVVKANDRTFVATAADVPEGFTLDPTVVSAWTALSENENSIVSTQRMISAMRGMGLTKESVVGEDNRNASIADSLISFNESAAKSKEDFAEDSFERKVLEHTESYLASLGITATCRFDDNGLIDIAGEAHGLLNNRESNIPVHAQIGQIFAPDEHNVVHVRRNHNDDFLFIPGYRAFVEEDDGSGKNLMERTVLTGYLQSACASIDNSLSVLINSTCRAMDSKNNTSVDVSLPTACNSVYGESYGTQLPENHMEKMMRGGFSEENVYAIYSALSGKIAYSREMDRDATTISSIGGDAQKTRALEIAGQNLREMGEECLGYVYTDMTNTGRGSGTRRYLCKTAKVADDGHIIKGDESDMRSDLFSQDFFKYVQHNALDRNVMSFSQVTSAEGVDKNAKGAHMLIAGWTMEDGYPVSKEFAERNMVEAADGSGLRPLQPGDKISDTNGNKGVINIVIDRNMSLEEAREKGIEDLYTVFKLNPELDFIGSPFSGMSRSNAGTALYMMENASPLRLPDGRVISGGMGTMPMLITNMTVDAKSHVYSDDSEHQRNSSGQLTWLLSAKKLNGVSREIYGGNEAGVNEFRAYLNIIGLTFDKKGVMSKGFGAQSDGVSRMQLVDDMAMDDGSGLPKVKSFDIYTLDETAKNPDNQYKLQRKLSAAKWDKMAKTFNGFVQLPFPVQGVAGDLEAIVKDENGNDKHIAVMPIVSSAYRSDIQHDNGETYSHDYTKNYSTIIQAAGEYISAATRLSKSLAKEAASMGQLLHGMTEEETEKILFDTFTSYQHDAIDKKTGRKSTSFEGYQREIITQSGAKGTCGRYITALLGNMPKDSNKKCMGLFNELMSAKVKGQSEYANIVNDTVAKKIEDRKHGVIASSIIKVGCESSATLVITAQPTLPIGKVAMSQQTLDDLSSEFGKPMYWRDPLLHVLGISSCDDIVVDNTLTGMAMNPAIAAAFNADFDGDSVGMKTLKEKLARMEADTILSRRANILDFGVGEEGNHPLVVNNTMDIQAAHFAHPELAQEFQELTRLANEEYSKYGEITEGTYQRISDNTLESLRKSSFLNVMNYESPQTVAESLLGMSKEFGNGAKGSVGKMKGFMEYMGYAADVDATGKVTVTPAPMSVERRLELNKGVCTALGCKCDETGVAGYASQKAMRALRNICPTEALALTYPVTQGMLQAKHDAEEAVLKANLTQNVIPDLWEGKRMLQDESGEWFVEHAEGKNQSSVPKQATVDEWKDQFMRVMCQANGIDIPRDASLAETRASFSSIMSPTALDVVADALTDKNGNIMGLTAKAVETAAPIDIMMYGVPSNSGRSVSITEALVQMAERHDSVFRGMEIVMPNSMYHANGLDGTAPQSSISSSYVAEMNVDKSMGIV